jgi:magnesium-transporting ATPase (P-type)
MNSKTIIGAIIGAFISFLLGWLLYGMLLANFFANNAGSAGNVMIGDNEMTTMNFVWIFVGNLCFALMLAYVFNRTNTNTPASGAAMGALLSALAAGGSNFIMLGTTTLSTTTAALADIGVSAVIGAIAGAAIAWWLGRGKV